MTKRRKLYHEKRRDAKRRASNAIQAVMRGVHPDDAIKYFRIFDHYALSMMRTLYIPRKERSGLLKQIKDLFSKWFDK